MAKQIYIDENGNEQLVSGTINNASLLPISASDTTNTKDYIDTGLISKANKEIVTLSFTSSNDGLYVIPTSTIPLTKYPVFAWEETEQANYVFPINNYRNTNWLMWCRNAQTMAIVGNQAFTVKVLVLS